MAQQSESVLTARQTEVMWGIVDGLSTKEIAVRLGMSEHTAKFHVIRAFSRLKAKTRSRAIALFVLANVDAARERLAVG
jgi:DNA-binding CsgD family transcriptional regulator